MAPRRECYTADITQRVINQIIGVHSVLYVGRMPMDNQAAHFQDVRCCYNTDT